MDKTTKDVLIVGAVGVAAVLAYNEIKDIGDGVKDGMDNMLNGLTKPFDDLADIPGDLLNSGKNMLGEFSDGLKDFGNNLSDSVKNTSQKASDNATDLYNTMVDAALGKSAFTGVEIPEKAKPAYDKAVSAAKAAGSTSGFLAPTVIKTGKGTYETVEGAKYAARMDTIGKAEKIPGKVYTIAEKKALRKADGGVHIAGNWY